MAAIHPEVTPAPGPAPGEGASWRGTLPIRFRPLALLHRWLGLSLAGFIAYIVLRDALAALFEVDLELLGKNFSIELVVALSLVAAVVWALREERVDSARLQFRLEVALRYLLGYIFITYGVAKLYQSQFMPASLYQLDRPLGDLTGMELAWRFFGYSYAYAAFIGLSQIAAALLLFFRRTALLGACLLMPIISNIVFINYSHQIPVKLNAGVYLVATAYLIARELPRLKAVLWDNAPTRSRVFPALDPRFRMGRAAGKGAAILASLAMSNWMFASATAPMREVVTPVYGIWRVERAEPPGVLVATEGEHRGSPWTKVLFEKLWQGKGGVVKLASGRSAFSYETDAQRRRLTIRSEDRQFSPWTGTYAFDSEGQLVLDGQMGGRPVRAVLVKEVLRGLR